MSPSSYRDLLRQRDLRRLVGVGMVARLPHSAAALVLMVHITQTLDQPYTAAGAVVAVFTVGVGIGSPWRGRQVDRVGLRRALAPSVLAQGLVWPILGIAPFWALFPVAFIGGLFAMPIFAVVRKALSVLVAPAGRRTAFALDAVCTEIVFMVGPALGVWGAAQAGSTAVLIALGGATTASGALLWWFNPPMTSASVSGAVATDADAAPPNAGIANAASPDAELAQSDSRPVGRSDGWHGWMSPAVVVVLAVSAAAVVALVGAEVGVLAQVRELGQPQYLGLAYVVWCASSAIGGLLYGALHRSISPVILVLILGLATAPLVFVESIPSLLVLLTVAGFACAPVMAATGEALSRLVPEERRGEAMGWQGSAFTVGGAIGSPIAGAAVDSFGAAGGFGAVAVIAVLVAGGGVIAQRWTRPRF